MKKVKIFLILLFGFFNFQLSHAQAFYEHEISINAGISQLRSDYGVSNDNETNFGNQGFSVSLNYYYNQAFRRSTSYFQDHFKPRVSLTYSSADLQHYGLYADDARLAAMTGNYTNLSIGGGLEYYPFRVRVYKATRSSQFLDYFSPFFGLGIGLNFVQPDAQSSLEGGLNNTANIFPTFVSETSENGINIEKLTVISLNLRSGLRYKLNNKSDLILESRWVIFSSDFIDGLSPVGPQNKSSDWSWGINIGFSYLLF